MTALARDSRPLSLILAPSSAGGRKRGQEEAPHWLLRWGLADSLRAHGHAVTVIDDIATSPYEPDPIHPREQNRAEVVRLARQLSQAVDAACDAGSWPVVIGGDCTITIGVLAAMTRRWPDLGLLYFDGDIDLNTPSTTPSGILDGMGMAHILGHWDSELSRLGVRFPMLDPSRVALFGYSDEAGSIDEAERRRLETLSIAKYPLSVVRGRAAKQAELAMQGLGADGTRVLVHFDVDVIDYHELPAADVAHVPGLGLADATDALQHMVAHAQSAGLVVTEFNPRDDADGTVALRLIELLTTALR